MGYFLNFHKTNPPIWSIIIHRINKQKAGGNCENRGDRIQRCGEIDAGEETGKLFRCPVLHLDRIQFEPGWKERDRGEAKRMAEEFLDENEKRGWIIDGNYTGFSQERRLKEADLIVFMNYPRWICLWQALMRSHIYRGRTREDMGDGCIEKTGLGICLVDSPQGEKQEKTASVPRDYRALSGESAGGEKPASAAQGHDTDGGAAKGQAERRRGRKKRMREEELLIHRLKRYERSDMYPFHMPGHNERERGS